MLVFGEEGKPENAGEKPSEQGWEPTTNSTHIYGARSRNRTQATSVGGECSHHCGIPTPPKSFCQVFLAICRYIFKGTLSQCFSAIFGSKYVSGKLPTYPSPNLTFWPKQKVSVNVRFGRGRWAVSQKHTLNPIFNKAGLKPWLSTIAHTRNALRLSRERYQVKYSFERKGNCNSL